MLTVFFCIVIAAFVAAVVAAIGKCPLWVSVILVCTALLIQALPLK